MPPQPPDGKHFPDVAHTTTVPFWEAAIAQAASPEFSFWLGRATDSAKRNGAFTFGGVSTSLYSGDIESNALTGPPASRWTLDISGFWVDGEASGLTAGAVFAQIDVHADTISGSLAYVADIWRRVPGSIALLLIDHHCFSVRTTCASKVNITIAFGGREWPINPQDLIFFRWLRRLRDVRRLDNRGPVKRDSHNQLAYRCSVLEGRLFGIPSDTPGYRIRSAVNGGGTPASAASSANPAPSSTSSANLGQTSLVKTSLRPGSSKKKPHVGAIVGGVVGGIAIAAFLAGLFFLLSRQRQRDRRQHSADQPQPSPPTRAPLSFVVDNPNNDEFAAPPSLPLADMKRVQQAAAVRYYGDTHVVPDVVTHTAGGLQLAPGQSTYSYAYTYTSPSPSTSPDPSSSPRTYRSQIHCV
ncbi:hypothetical protein C8J57DRAFT_1512747 [Mycena rebaudengoi]|nr:hypothetical protein C8J57DRAFT_1512747 [Mycena rebaudengoi]